MPRTRPPPILPFMFCDTHKTALLDLYCITHDDVICTTCNVASHRECDTRDVKRHSAGVNVGVELNEVIKSLREISSRYDDFIKRRNLDRTSLKTQVQNCLSDVHRMRKDVNDMLNELEKNMTSEIHEMEQAIEAEIDRHVTLADDILRQIGNIDSSLSECQKTLINDVIYVGVRKASSRAREYDHTVRGLNADTNPPDVRFEPNDVLSDPVKQFQSLGTVVNNQPVLSGHSDRSVLGLTVRDRGDIDVKTEIVTGSIFMPDGHFVLACFNDGLKLFDKDFQFKSHLFGPCIDVVATNDTDVVVTQGNLKQLRHVRILPDMAVKNTVTTGRKCWGVDVNGDNMFVTYHDNPGRGEVRVLDMGGRVKSRLGVDGEEYMFTKPWRVKVNRDGSKVIVSDWDTHILTCLDRQGHVIYNYSGRDLVGPMGMYVDGGGNLLQCGFNSNNVHVVRRDGTRERIMLSKEDGIQYPKLISYRPSDGCRVVVIYNAAYTVKTS